MIGWGLANPARRSLRKESELDNDLVKIKSIVDQTNSKITHSLKNLMGLVRGIQRHRQRRANVAQQRISQELVDGLGGLDGQKMRQRSKRSYGGWTCSDLAIILREYDFVITLLERINNFIKIFILCQTCNFEQHAISVMNLLTSGKSPSSVLQYFIAGCPDVFLHVY